MAVDPSDPSTLYVSANVDPGTDAALTHYQIFRGISADGGQTWAWTQLTNSLDLDNVRPVITYCRGYEALLWMQGSYTACTNYDTDIVGLIVTDQLLLVVLATAPAFLTRQRHRPPPLPCQ